MRTASHGLATAATVDLPEGGVQTPPVELLEVQAARAHIGGLGCACAIETTVEEARAQPLKRAETLDVDERSTKSQYAVRG